MRGIFSAGILFVTTLFVLVSQANSQWSKAKITSKQLTPPWVSPIAATASYDNRHIAIDRKGNYWIYLIADETWYWRASDFPTDIIDAEWPSANTLAVLRSNGTLRVYRWPERTIQWEVDVEGTERLTYNYGRFVCYSSNLVKVVHPSTLTVETTTWNTVVVAASYMPNGPIVLLDDGTVNVVREQSMVTTSVTTEVPVVAGGIKGNVLAYASNTEMGTLRLGDQTIDTLQIHALPNGIRIERDKMLVTDSGSVLGTLTYNNTKYPLIIDNERKKRQSTWTRGDLRIPRATSPRYAMLSWGYIFIVGDDASIRRLGFNTIDSAWVLNYQSVPSTGVTVLDRTVLEDGKLISLLRCAPPYQPWQTQSISTLLRHAKSDSVESWTIVPNQFVSGGRIVAVTDDGAILTSTTQTVAVDLQGVVTEMFSNDPRCSHIRRYKNNLYAMYEPPIVSKDLGKTWDSVPVPLEDVIGGFFLTDTRWTVKTLVDGKPGTSAWYINFPDGEYSPVSDVMSPISFFSDSDHGETCLVIDWSFNTGVAHSFYQYVDKDANGAPKRSYEIAERHSVATYKIHIGVQQQSNTFTVFDVDRSVSPTRMHITSYSRQEMPYREVIGLPVMESARVAHAYMPHPNVIVITYDDGTEFTYDLRATSSTVESDTHVNSDVLRRTEDGTGVEIDADVAEAYVVDYTGQQIPHSLDLHGLGTRIVFGSHVRRGVYAVRVVLRDGSVRSSFFMFP